LLDEEIVGFIIYLTSEDTGAVTGTMLLIDFGLTTGLW
jgi:hypothetical protein